MSDNFTYDYPVLNLIRQLPELKYTITLQRQ